VTLEAGIPTTTSLKIADGTNVQNKNVLELIRDNIDDFAEFGRVAFETQPFQTAGGVQHRDVAYLTEEHATLLLTYMRNSAVVRDFKKRLVREFWQLRRSDARTPAIPQTYAEALRAAADQAERAELAEARNRELEPKAGFYDDFMDADGTYSFLAAAKILGWGRNVMMRELRRCGVLQGDNLPYQRYEHHFKVTPGTYKHPNTGELIPTATTTVRPSGLEFLRKKLDRSPVVTS
jgi:phage regulator Rha-like protein